MELEQAKDAVMEASGQLVALGLVARTWGNVSCRVGESHFLITPSGRPYESLTKEQLVLVSLEDLSYPKGVKPSSEKKLHREVYKLKGDVGCVIHTHQEMASLAGLLGKDIPVSKQGKPLLAETIAMARYGLPGTKTLVKNAAKAIIRNNATTVLLANHGSLCFGRDALETLEIAKRLEVECRTHLAKLLPLLGEERDLKVRTLPVVLSRLEEEPEHTEELHQGQELTPNRARKIACSLATGEGVQRSVLFLSSPAVLAAGKMLTSLPSYLDDFAQIAGAVVPVATLEICHTRFKAIGKRCNALLIRDEGALCWANTRSDAEAVALILEKNCKAALLAQEDAIVKPIGWLDARLMRFVYQKKYSKIAQGEEA
ncbi:MAG: class II aldolase/adducin family protein [Sphaerochaeta sp.]|nr:class II aldolase/adducin family protein [Sphaerochaeta sp.]